MVTPRRSPEDPDASQKCFREQVPLASSSGTGNIVCIGVPGKPHWRYVGSPGAPKTNEVGPLGTAWGPNVLLKFIPRATPSSNNASAAGPPARHLYVVQLLFALVIFGDCLRGLRAHTTLTRRGPSLILLPHENPFSASCLGNTGYACSGQTHRSKVSRASYPKKASLIVFPHENPCRSSGMGNEGNASGSDTQRSKSMLVDLSESECERE